MTNIFGVEFIPVIIVLLSSLFLTSIYKYIVITLISKTNSKDRGKK